MARARAIKTIPSSPPLSACRSTLLAHELGSMISKAPKKEAAKTSNNKKNKRLNHTLVERAFKESAPKIPVINEPRST